MAKPPSYYRSADVLTLAFDEYQRGNLETATQLVGAAFTEPDFSALLVALGHHNAKAEATTVRACAQSTRDYETAGDYETVESQSFLPDTSPWAVRKEAPNTESAFLRRFRVTKKRKEYLRQQQADSS